MNSMSVNIVCNVLCNQNGKSPQGFINIFLLCCFFSQYLQDESKTKRNIDLNLLEWTHYSMKPHVSNDPSVSEVLSCI